MNAAIKRLNALLKTTHSDTVDIETALQKEWNKVFNDMPKLAKAIECVESASEWSFDRYGELQRWWRFRDMDDFKDCREYLTAWLSDQGVHVDRYYPDVLTMSEGDAITIQDDSHHAPDNGVWFNSDQIIAETEYKDEETGDVDKAKRNALIEAWMEKNGYFPGVFRVTQYGDVFPVNTQAKGRE